MAPRPRVDSGEEEHLRRVEIADAGHRPLIQESHIHRQRRAAEVRDQFCDLDQQRIRAKSRRPAGHVESMGIQQPQRSKPTTIPEEEALPGPARRFALQP